VLFSAHLADISIVTWHDGMMSTELGEDMCLASGNKWPHKMNKLVCIRH